MKIKKRYKLVIGVVLVFISGLMLGGGVTYFVISNRKKVAPLDKFRTETFKLMVRELKLTPEQQVKVGILLDNGLARMKKFRLEHASEIFMIIRKNHQGIAKILTPEQWEIYADYREDKLDEMQKNIP